MRLTELGLERKAPLVINPRSLSLTSIGRITETKLSCVTEVAPTRVNSGIVAFFVKTLPRVVKVVPVAAFLRVKYPAFKNGSSP